MAGKNESRNDEIIFEDVDSYSTNKEGTSIKEITLEQLKKCIKEGSKEMTSGGGIMQRYVNGQLVEIPIPNQIEIFINNVEMLRIILLPKIENKKDIMKKYLEDFDNTISRLNKTYNAEMEELNKWILTRPAHQRSGLQEIYNHKLKTVKDNYEFKRYWAYKDLLCGFSMLLAAFNYFEEEAITWTV